MKQTSSETHSGGNQSQAGAALIDADGERAEIVSIEQTGSGPQAMIRTARGRDIALPMELLDLQDDGSYRVPLSFQALASDDRDASLHPHVIPVWHEELQIDKRTVETGKGVRISKTVRHETRIVDEPLLQDELIIERVPVGTMLDAGEQPAARYEGDILVVPVLEEVLVVEKRMRLTEEVRIARRSREVRMPQEVVLRSEKVSIERFNESDGASPRPDAKAGPGVQSFLKGEPDAGDSAG
jgi:uncharacterized protein (TIGR02271 family)